MTRLDIRRLGVTYKGNLVGIISSKDILAVMPELIEIMQERHRIEGDARTEEFIETPLRLRIAAILIQIALKNVMVKIFVTNAESNWKQKNKNLLIPNSVKTILQLC